MDTTIKNAIKHLRELQAIKEAQRLDGKHVKGYIQKKTTEIIEIAETIKKLEHSK